MATSLLTENDILKSLVRRGAISDLCKELNINIMSSPRAEKPDASEQQQIQRDQLRQIAKIWTALSKLIRSQCNKGRIIDSLYFGSFGKTIEVSGDENASKTYTYCPGPKSLFKLRENAENVQQVPQAIIDQKLVSTSFQAIADVCNCGADMVQGVLSTIRDEVMDTVQNRKKEVALNLQIGQLSLHPSGHVQFRSLTVAEALNKAQAMSGTASVRLTEASLRGLGHERNGKSNSSQKNLDDRSIAERSINYMQQRQSTASVGSRARRQVLMTSSGQKGGDQIFGTPSQTDKKSLAGKMEGNTEDAPYFQRRMLRSRAKRTGSHAENIKRRDVLIESTPEQPVNHTHLDQFLRDQIMSQKSGRSKAQRSAVSCSSSKKNNALIEYAATNKSRYTARQKPAKTDSTPKKEAVQFNDTVEDDSAQLVVAANVMRMSNYQSDPLAATMQTRSLGLSKLNVTKDQLAQDKDLYSKSLKVNKNRLENGLKIESVETRSNASSKIVSPKVIKEMTDVEAALYRKKISDKYHTSVPKFLRSQGPFAVYDHSAHKGFNSYDKIGNVNEQAIDRFNSQVQGVQRMREQEKNQFYSAMDYMDRVERAKKNSQQKQNKDHVNFIRNQIEEKQRREQHEQVVEKLYYKPHFGPEETLDQIKRNMDSQKQKQDFLRMNLTHQINAQRELSEASRQQERHVDKKFIKACTEAQTLEHVAMVKKDQIMKQNLRETWQRQIAFKQDHEVCDKYFK